MGTYTYPKCQECGARLTTRWEIGAGRCDKHGQEHPRLGMLGASFGLFGVVALCFFVIWILEIFSK